MRLNVFPVHSLALFWDLLRKAKIELKFTQSSRNLALLGNFLFPACQAFVAAKTATAGLPDIRAGQACQTPQIRGFHLAQAPDLSGVFSDN